MHGILQHLGDIPVCTKIRYVSLHMRSYQSTLFIRYPPSSLPVPNGPWFPYKHTYRPWVGTGTLEINV